MSTWTNTALSPTRQHAMKNVAIAEQSSASVWNVRRSRKGMAHITRPNWYGQMPEHLPLYEIAQKIWEAATSFERELHAKHNRASATPAAYSIITPLVQELEKYVDEHVKASKHRIILNPQPFRCSTRCKEPSVFEIITDLSIGPHEKPKIRRKRSCLIHGQRFAEKHGLELPPLPFDGEDGG